MGRSLPSRVFGTALSGSAVSVCLGHTVDGVGLTYTHTYCRHLRLKLAFFFFFQCSMIVKPVPRVSEFVSSIVVAFGASVSLR